MCRKLLKNPFYILLQECITNFIEWRGQNNTNIAIRSFKGDKFAKQFEDGGKKGGNYFRACRIHASKFHKYDVAFTNSLTSMEKRRYKLIEGSTCKEKVKNKKKSSLLKFAKNTR